MEEVGLLQATVDAIGEADNEIGGFRQTRVTALAQTELDTPDSFEWSGTLVSYQRNPTEMLALPRIRLGSDGRLFQVTGVTALGGGDYQVDVDLAGATAPQTVIYAVSGLANFFALQEKVNLNAPEEVPVGGWIRATGDPNWYEVIDKSGITVTITNPHGFTIPSGVTTVEYSPNPVVYINNDEISVESVLNWPEDGQVAIDGVLYDYASKTLSPMKLLGLTYFDAGETIIGLAQTHSVGAVVTDLTREYSALEDTRNAMLVDYADGADLNTLGRNLGVLRFPFLVDDSVFREIIKAIAYNPRGTMFGLELALNALVGEGNYELREDLINSPCTVFVNLLGDGLIDDRSEGKTFLTGPEVVDPTTTTSIPITGTVATRGTAYSVRLKDHSHEADLRLGKPSTFNIEDIPGSPVQAWGFFGTGGATEGANVTYFAGQGIAITHPAGGISRYFGNRRFEGQYTDWSVDCVMRLPLTSIISINPADVEQWGVEVHDARDIVGWGCFQHTSNPNLYYIGLTSGGVGVGTPQLVVKEAYFTVQLRKRGELDGIVDLVINGEVKDSRKRSAFTTATSLRVIRFGIHLASAPTSITGHMASVAFNLHTPSFDYWNLYNFNADLGAPNTVQITTSEFQAGDVGKAIELYNSAITNPGGGNNNGKFEVLAYTDANNVTVQGVEQVDAAATESVNPLRITVSTRKQQFVYPDDLGKEIVLLDSAQGNNGTYVIEKLFEPGSAPLKDLATYATPLRTVTNVCEVVEPSLGFAFVPETAISFRLDPVFVAEVNRDFILSDAASESGGVITLREALPTANEIVDVYYNDVLSALVLLDFAIKNVIVQELPTVLWQYYPFYLSDPLGFVQAYLDDITAAGVIPEYFVE